MTWGATRLLSPHLQFAASCLVALLAGLTLAACSIPTDEQYFPPTNVQTFAMTTVTLPLPAAAPQPLNPVIVVSLSDLPDPATVQFPTLQLGPRGHSIEFFVQVSLVDRQLTLWPKNPLLPETDYFVGIAEDLRALSGQRLAQAVSVQFHTGSFMQPATVVPGPVALGQILGGTAGLRARCTTAGCHSASVQSDGTPSPPAAGLDFTAADTALQAQLTGSRGRGSLEALLLVQPGLPEQSYLLRKLVANTGFSRISGEPMPPFGPPLDLSVLRALELWIRQGAH